MNFEDVITGKDIEKSFGSFKLDVPELHIPKGFATALIGENGAGKTTLLNLLTGLRLDGQGETTYFGKYVGPFPSALFTSSVRCLSVGYSGHPKFAAGQVPRILGRKKLGLPASGVRRGPKTGPQTAGVV